MSLPPSPYAALDSLLITMRGLPPRMTKLWDVAYGRASLAAMGPDAALASSDQERGLRVLLALALMVPEDVLRKRFERVLAPTAGRAELIELLRPLLIGRDAVEPETYGVRGLVRATLDELGIALPLATAAAKPPAARPARTHSRPTRSRSRRSARA